MDDGVKKKTDMQELLMRRHKERLEKFEERRRARLKEKADSNETSEAFLCSFNKEKREITVILNNLKEKQARMEITASFDDLTKRINHLQKFVSDSLSFLPGYDMRRAQEILKQLRADVSDRRDVLLPKKKFAFKSRQKLTSSDVRSNDQQNQEKNGTPSSEPLNLSENIGFTDRSNETLTLQSETCNNKDLYLANLVDCTIYIYGHLSAVKLEKLINTEIYCGPVSRSVFVNDCFDCTFQLACQQLRIHTTGSTKFYIHVTSKAIIEDCEGVGFAPYSWSYESLNDDFEQSGLQLEKNNWKDVDDFNWLKLDEQSPNWHLL